jgi:hypothetical protein
MAEPGARLPLAARRGSVAVCLGKGATVRRRAGGTVSLCPLPACLLQAGDAQHSDLLDLGKPGKQPMQGQILLLASSCWRGLSVPGRTANPRPRGHSNGTELL